MKTKQTVEEQVMEAYYDCNAGMGQPYAVYEKRRNLNFLASEPVSRNEAVAIMRKAIPGGYNEFDADKLAWLPSGSMVTIAREGSVCVYVAPPLKEIPDMQADEWHAQDGGTTRIWWD